MPATAQLLCMISLMVPSSSGLTTVQSRGAYTACQALLCKASGILLSRQMQAPQCGCDNRRLHACQAAGHEPRLRSRSWGSADGKIVHVAENPHDEGLVPALFRGRVQLVRCMAMVRVAPRLPPPTSDPRKKSRWAKEIVQKKDAFQAPITQLKFYMYPG